MAIQLPAARAAGTSDPSVERTRAPTGLLAVVAGDVAISSCGDIGYRLRGQGVSTSGSNRSHTKQRPHSYWYHDYGLLRH